MIRVSTIINASTLTIRNLNGYDHLIFNGPNVQCVRWKRKPIWLPTAKSKLFRVPKRPVIPEEEAAELKRLFNNYRTCMKSLRSYFVKLEKTNTQEFDTEAMKRKAEEDFIKCSKVNDYWNKQVAVERQFRQTEERAKHEEQILLKLETREQANIKTQMKIDAEIRKAKIEAVTFITPDNIDQAIENVLHTTVDHNVAIDLNGNFYTDNYTETLKTTNSAESTM
ncbi:mitochondrial ribosomal protein S26 [Calliopsis andreniformis]|uniref:mitochondrial ribosomal protein S26 n=1 Tax=Calliopsis andreniformis TaxID=337506 RepID=UPI003FCD0A5C